MRVKLTWNRNRSGRESGRTVVFSFCMMAQKKAGKSLKASWTAYRAKRKEGCSQPRAPLKQLLLSSRERIALQDLGQKAAQTLSIQGRKPLHKEWWRMAKLLTGRVEHPGSTSHREQWHHVTKTSEVWSTALYCKQEYAPGQSVTVTERKPLVRTVLVVYAQQQCRANGPEDRIYLPLYRAAPAEARRGGTAGCMAGQHLLSAEAVTPKALREAPFTHPSVPWILCQAC